MGINLNGVIMNNGIVYLVCYTVFLWLLVELETWIDSKTMKKGDEVSHRTGEIFYAAWAIILWGYLSLLMGVRLELLASTALYAVSFRTLFFNLRLNKKMGWKTWYMSKKWYIPLKPWHRVGLYMVATLWLVSDLYDVFGSGVEWFLAYLIGIGALGGMIREFNRQL